MDNRGQVGQIAELIDMLAAKGVRGVKVAGFAGLDGLELELGPKTIAQTFPQENNEPTDEDIQYAATGLVPINLREMRK